MVAGWMEVVWVESMTVRTSVDVLHGAKRGDLVWSVSNGPQAVVTEYALR